MAKYNGSQVDPSATAKEVTRANRAKGISSAFNGDQSEPAMTVGPSGAVGWETEAPVETKKNPSSHSPEAFAKGYHGKSMHEVSDTYEVNEPKKQSAPSPQKPSRSETYKAVE